MSIRPFRWIPLLMALAVLAGVMVFVAVKMSPAAGGPPGGPTGQGAGQAAEQDAAVRPDVSVVEVTAGRYQPRVEGYGEASPHYELELTAQVSGRVESLSDRFASGRVVPAGEPLATLDDKAYQEAVAEAEATLATNRVSLLEEQREGEQARRDWQRSGLNGDPDSPLVLRAPQLAATQADVKQAEQALASAQEDLADTRIEAPFDALVVSRDVAPGSYLQAGGSVATLYSTDRVEIAVALSASEWARLEDPESGEVAPEAVTLSAVDTGQQWQGRVLRSERHLDEDRQRSLIVAVDAPLAQTPALLPGTFLEVSLEGREIDGLWRLPPSALSQAGEIWYLTEGDHLASVAVDPLFSDRDYLYVRPPAELAEGTHRVVSHPLNSYLPGMVVTPVEVDGNA
ncbi:efflux RND transporter periplasmic adaptor subunit [Halomonas getboli]|uniref:efflux RND transporter periplasmic adaptor subunit n=1 Tax=Halomonas getboli TaxID=2935862 RepID=UPI0020000F8A|nr:efflux RND transporter periplasmic adaptor subunit [Halomonas getboli]MCK2182750.1 efflux RND transporter periplasmic adaptor subunit [Halomonas getboli]